MIVRVHFHGLLPMIVQSQRSMNYRDPLARQLQELASKRGKTIEDRIAISDLEMQLGLYYDEKLGPFLPAFNVKTCIKDGGKLLKLGTHVQQAVRSLPGNDKFAIQYEGPRTIEGLLEDGRFRDVRNVVVSNRAVERTRPIFPAWSLSGLFLLDNDRLDLHKFKSCIQKAGAYIGCGGFRPEFGIFSGSVEEVSLDAGDLAKLGLTEVA